MKMHTLLFVPILLVSLIIASGAFAATEVALLRGTESWSPIRGTVAFRDTENGLLIRAEVENAPRGKHGFHIHEFGLTTNGGKDAGGHFNPDGNPHGLITRDGIENVHAGDLGNIVVGSDGRGTLELTVEGLSLTEGKYAVAGRAVILHALEDDFGQPTGNAGGRIAAGSILITGH